MKNIDIDWLMKFQSIVDRMNRSVVPYRQCSRCDKEVFTIRVFNKLLKNKSYKLRINDKVYYGMFIECIIKVNGEPAYKKCGVNFHLGYSNSEYTISFFDATKSNFTNLSKLHWNTIINIEYNEVPNEEFYTLASKFI